MPRLIRDGPMQVTVAVVRRSTSNASGLVTGVGCAQNKAASRYAGVTSDRPLRGVICPNHLIRRARESRRGIAQF